MPNPPHRPPVGPPPTRACGPAKRTSDTMLTTGWLLKERASMNRHAIVELGPGELARQKITLGDLLPGGPRCCEVAKILLMRLAGVREETTNGVPQSNGAPSIALLAAVNQGVAIGAQLDFRTGRVQILVMHPSLVTPELGGVPVIGTWV